MKLQKVSLFMLREEKFDFVIKQQTHFNVTRIMVIWTLTSQSNMSVVKSVARPLES